MKIKCLDLAGKEQLEMHGMIKAKDLFDRARDLYSLAQLNNLLEWGVSAKKEKPPKKTIQKTESKNDKVASKGKKFCPGCGEEIPEGFKIHRYNSKGEKCGTIF